MGCSTKLARTRVRAKTCQHWDASILRWVCELPYLRRHQQAYILCIQSWTYFDTIVSGVLPVGASCNRLSQRARRKRPSRHQKYGSPRERHSYLCITVGKTRQSRGSKGVRPAGEIKGYVCPGAGSSHNNS